MKLKDLLKKLQGERLALDSSFFLRHLESDSRFEPVTSGILRSVESGKSRAWASILVLHDLFLRLAHGGSSEAMATCQAVLSNFPNLKLVAIDEPIIAGAARLEAEYGLNAWNALQLSCALTGGARFFITADRGLPAIPGIETVLLDSIQT